MIPIQQQQHREDTNSEDQGSRREQRRSATDGRTNDDPIAGAHHADGGAADQLDPIVRRIEFYARAFATTHDLEQYSDEIVWAAKVRHDQQRTIEEGGFPPHEGEVLKDEGTRIFSSHRRSLKSAVLVVGVLSAGCQGWYQSVISSTITYMIRDFNLQVDKIAVPSLGNHDLWVLGALVAVVPMAAGILSPFIADPLQNHLLGRRGAVSVAAAVSTCGTIGLMFADKPAEVIGLRILIGISLGAKASVIPPLLAELAPVHYRGRVLATWQLADATGIFIGFICWAIIDNITYEGVTNEGARAPLSDRMKWKILSALPLITTVPLIIVAYMIPESYIFLLKTRKYRKALDSALEYADGRIQGLRNLIEAHIQMDRETGRPRQSDLSIPCRAQANNGQNNRTIDLNNPNLTLAQRIRENLDLIRRPRINCSHDYHMREINFYLRLWKVIFGDRRSRNAFISSGIVMVTQALCGINVFAFFASSQVGGGIPESNSLWLALSFGGVNCFAGFITLALTDRFGRTTLLLTGLPIMTVLMFILASVFEANHGPGRTVAIYMVLLAFTAVYSFTLGPAAFSLAAESFPSSVREAGMALCVFLNMFSLGLLLALYPFTTERIDYTTSLCIIGALDFVAFILCFLYCVDTQKRTLDQMQFNFEQRLSLHANYRLFEVLPALFKRTKPATFHVWALNPGRWDPQQSPIRRELRGLIKKPFKAISSRFGGRSGQPDHELDPVTSGGAQPWTEAQPHPSQSSQAGERPEISEAPQPP